MDHPRRLDVGDGALEVDVLGQGEPVVVIQTALGVDELGPLARDLAAAGRHRVVHDHRRGYAGSSAPVGAPAVDRDAADCAALVAALGLAPVHVVGASDSAAVAPTVAASTPHLVRSVSALEPPPVHARGGEAFRAVDERLARTIRTHGTAAALDELMTLVGGDRWRQQWEHDLPGSVAAMERDAATFFGRDVPALRTWVFGAREARALRCPVLHVAGEDSGPPFDAVRDWLVGLLPAAETATVSGAGHGLASTHPTETARLVLDFLDRHAGPGHAPATVRP